MNLFRPIIDYNPVGSRIDVQFFCLILLTDVAVTLILTRGLFEWDDVIHNSLGCMVGCMISSCWMKHRGKRREK